MSKRAKTYLFLAAVLVLLLVLWIGRKRQPQSQAVSSGGETISERTVQGVSERQQLTSNNQDTDTFAVPTAESSAQGWEAAIRERNVSIQFWGKTVDQSGTPLEKVSVSASTRVYLAGTNHTGYTLFSKTNVLSGTEGLFEITGMKGDSLKIDGLSKDGYEPEANALRVFAYGPSSAANASPDNPVTFRLWKEGLKQPLITGQRVCHFVPDSRRYNVNLADGTIAEASTNGEGDLQFWVQRAPDAKRRQPYDWTFCIEIPDGGIVQEFVSAYADMSLAPEAGYTNAYRSVHRLSDNPWDGSEGQDRFYLKLHGGGSYARMQIGVNSFNDPVSGEGRLSVEYSLNPSGSRALR